MLCEETVLTHFDPTQEIGISCDASQVGLGVVLFHRYSSEKPRKTNSLRFKNSYKLPKRIRTNSKGGFSYYFWLE
jgi:hypothetical protein